MKMTNIAGCNSSSETCRSNARFDSSASLYNESRRIENQENQDEALSQGTAVRGNEQKSRLNRWKIYNRIIDCRWNKQQANLHRTEQQGQILYDL